jgi:protein O-GlcNAc transferase
MRFYNEIDIALDPFPYTGGMTTCETLYMGVPIIALDGDGIRTSQSLLTLTGVSELIANTAEEYIFKAISLARNPQRIQEYKQTLRAKMLQSPIMNGTNFTKEVESAYRKVWEIWCDGQ